MSAIFTDNNTHYAFPLVSILRMYCVGRRILYLDHMKGMKLLIDWLGLPNIKETELLIPMAPWFEANYEVHQLAKLLHCSPELVTLTLRELYGY